MRDILQKLTTVAGLALLHGALSVVAANAEEIPEHFTPVRPAGMGGAFTAIANDESAVWTNPAGVGRTRKHRSRAAFHVFKFPNVIAGANKDSRNFYDTFKGAGDSSVADAVSNSDDFTKPLYVRGAAFPVAVFDTVGRQAPMAFGLYSNTTAKVVVEKDSPEEARVDAVSDLGSVITFGLTDQNNRLNLGLQARPVMRYAYEDRIPSGDLPDRDKMKERFQNDANKMTGVGLDAGAMYTVGDFWYPTIGIAVFNLPTGCKEQYLNPFTETMTTVCGNVYTGDINNPDALSTVDPMDLRAGVSITPRFGRKVAVRFALDVHQIPVGDETQSYGLQGIDAAKLIHAGAELFLGNPLEINPVSIRGGYSQGFATAGATLNLGFMTFDFATYGRDVASGPKPVEDRRYLGAISLGF
jgi:hypothetical protein